MNASTATDTFELADMFRDGMSRVASAVHIITTNGPAGRAGLTATAMTSLSAEPPMLLICVKRASASAATLIENRVFSVNTLRDDQIELADIFAGRRALAGEERFSSIDWSEGETGAPVLPDPLVVFDCRIIDLHNVASHSVVIGQVIAVRLGKAGQGLVYAGRTYHAV